jgi:hypothetical protein
MAMAYFCMMVNFVAVVASKLHGNYVIAIFEGRFTTLVKFRTLRMLGYKIVVEFENESKIS